MTTEEKLKPFLFPVKETQVLVHDSEKYGLRPTNKYKAIVRADNDNLVSIMRDTYKLIPNREIVLPLIDQLNSIDSKWYIDDSHSFTEDSRMRLQVTFPDLTFNDGRSDIALSLFLHNSYDGSEGVRMFWGAIRFICSNGMVFGHILSKFYGRHTSGLDIGNIKESLEKTYEQIPVIKHRINILQNLKVDKTIKRKVEDSLGKNIMKYVDEQPNPVNQWKLLNILTYYISHNLEQRLRSGYQYKLSKVFEL
jgi:hypothetical protein